MSGPEGGFARETEVGESDPNADSAEGLAGGMGVSSERVGTVAGSDGDVTYAAGDTQVPEPDAAQDEDLPEQSADPATPEGRAETDLPTNDFDHTHNPGHSHG